MENISAAPWPINNVENHIYLIRGRGVMLDGRLAQLYGVEDVPDSIPQGA